MFGEDSELGLRVRESGYRSTFSPETFVWHRVRTQTFWEWLLEPRFAQACPFLARRFPEIRKTFFFLHYFMTPVTAMFDLLVVGLILAVFVSHWFAVLMLPYIVAKFFDGGQHLNPLMRVVRMLGGSVRATVLLAVLIRGSIRFRSLVL